MGIRTRALAFAAAAFGLLLSASPVSAHCWWNLDRERTVPGGEFYGLGEFAPGEYVEVHWGGPHGPVIDSFVVAGSQTVPQRGINAPQVAVRRRLFAPQDAKPGYVIVSAVVQGSGVEPYTLNRGIWVDDPSAPPPAAEPSRSQQGPPAPPATVHEPVPNEAPAPQKAPARQEAPAREAVRAAARQPVAQPQPRPASEEAPDGAPVPQPLPVDLRAPVGIPQPAPADDGHSPSTAGTSRLPYAGALGVLAAVAASVRPGHRVAWAVALASAVAWRLRGRRAARPC